MISLAADFPSFRARLIFRVAGLAALIAAAGCFAPAVALAPLAVQAVEGVGMGGAYLASNAAAPQGRGADPTERRERCDEFQDAPPNLIELRQETDGSVQWRDLRLNYSGRAPAWAAATGADGAWRPLKNLLAMSFTPPVTLSFSHSGSVYLAYAPAEPQTSVEDDQLTNMTGEFGAGSGTFRWNERTYEYSVAEQLPCFPPPLAATD